MVKQLDSNLSIGDEIKKVYKELMKTINEDYLIFHLVICFKIIFTYKKN